MFGTARKLPAGPALLSITSGAPLCRRARLPDRRGLGVRVQSSRCASSPPGDRRADVVALTEQMAQGVRARDRGGAFGLAHVPAGLAGSMTAPAFVRVSGALRARRADVPVRLGRPRRRADPRPGARRASARGRSRGHRAGPGSRPRPRRRGCGRSGGPWTSRTTPPTRRSTRGRGRCARSRTSSAAFGPTSSTCTSRSHQSTSMWATLAARGAGGGDVPFGCDPVATVRRCRAAAASPRPAHRGAGRGLRGRGRRSRGRRIGGDVRHRAQRGRRGPVRAARGRRPRPRHARCSSWAASTSARGSRPRSRRSASSPRASTICGWWWPGTGRIALRWNGLAAAAAPTHPMLGPVPNVDLPPISAACDLFLGSARWEARASASCWSRPWRRGCRSWPATSPATGRSSATASTDCWCRLDDPAALADAAGADPG